MLRRRPKYSASNNDRSKRHLTADDFAGVIAPLLDPEVDQSDSPPSIDSSERKKVSVPKPGSDQPDSHSGPGFVMEESSSAEERSPLLKSGLGQTGDHSIHRAESIPKPTAQTGDARQGSCRQSTQVP